MVKEHEDPIILICDDTPKNIQVLGTILMDKGYQVTVAEDGTECLKMLEDVNPDLILLDVMMPYLDGYQTCEKIKSNPKFEDIPIIFLSAKNEVEDIIKGLEMGAVDYVSKPFNSLELLQRVKTQLEIKNNRDIILNQRRRLTLLLENLEEGFLIFGENGDVEPGWTHSVQEFIGNSPEGLKIYDFLPFNGEEKECFKNWCEKLWRSRLLVKDLMPLAPRGFFYGDEFFQLKFVPIFIGENKKVLDKVICTLINKTQEKNLEEKSAREKNDVSMMVSVLKNPFEFLDFIEERSEIMSELLDELRTKIKSWKVDSPSDKDVTEFCNYVFRKVHTIKAESTKYFLYDIKKYCSLVENIIFYLRDRPSENLWPKLDEILELLQKVNGAFSRSFFSVQRFLDIINHEQDSASFKRVEIKSVYQFLEKQFKKEKKLLKEFRDNYFYQDIDFFFKGQDKMLENMAHDIRKEVNLKIKKSEINFDMNIYSQFFSTLIHIIRNSLDHGIEEKELREVLGKKKSGLIEISCKKEKDQNIIINLSDDGKGIEPESIRSRLLELGKFQDTEVEKLSDEEVLQKIFLPGFSTKKEVGSISGLGVGLNAVKDEVLKLKGEIVVESVVGKGTKFIIKLPFKEKKE